VPSLRRVVPALPRRRQAPSFSATLSAEVERLSDRNVVAQTVTHCVHPVALDRKRDRGFQSGPRDGPGGHRHRHYVHRVGRTGRAGADGQPISLITALDHQLLHDIQCLLPTALERVVTAGFEIAHASRPSYHRGESRVKRSVSI
jgi:superfamily II DNA/RNA helicase